MRRTARGLLPFASLSISLALLAAGCSDPGEQVTTTGSPGGRDDPLFVSIEAGGGFVPQGVDFRQPPTAVIYSDGLAFRTGFITLQYPGPAVLPVTRGQLTSAQVDQILEAAEKAGLTGEPRDGGRPPVADAPTTTITVVADGKTHKSSFEALQEAPMEPSEGSDLPPGMTEDDFEARRQAREFVDFVSSMVERSEASEYEPDRYRVLPQAVDGSEPAPGAEQATEPQPQTRDWPFAHIALVENECAAVTGPDAVNFRQTLQEANEMTRWRTQSGQLYNLAARAVLPHEPDCPEGPEPESP